MNMNTTENITGAGTAMLRACERTAAELAERMKKAGIADGKTEKVVLPVQPGGEEVVFCGLNGVKFYFRRGESVKMPSAVAEILRECGILEGGGKA